MIYIIKSNNSRILCRDTPLGIILKPKNRNNRFAFRQASLGREKGQVRTILIFLKSL